MNNFKIGEKVNFRKSLKQSAQLQGTILSFDKRSVEIQGTDGNLYKVHINRLKKLQPAFFSSPKKPYKPQRQDIKTKIRLNQEVESLYFTAHSAKRYSERLTNYSASQIEKLFKESEEVFWEVNEGDNLRSFYHQESKVMFITNMAGTALVTHYKKYNAPSLESKSLYQQKQQLHHRFATAFEEDLEELDLYDSRIFNKTKKSFKRERAKMPKKAKGE